MKSVIWRQFLHIAVLCQGVQYFKRISLKYEAIHHRQTLLKAGRIQLMHSEDLSAIKSYHGQLKKKYNISIRDMNYFI